MGLALLFRPEGAVVALALFGTTFFILGREQDLRAAPRSKARFMAAALAFLVVSAAGLGFGYVKTGFLFFSASAESRMLTAGLEAVPLGFGVYFDPRVSLRLLYYLPLLLGAVCYAVSLPKRLSRTGENSVSPERWFYWRLTITEEVIAGALILYSFISGSHHVGRYLIWIIPLLLFTCAACLGSIGAAAPGRLKSVVLLSALGLCVAYGGEIYARVQRFKSYLFGDLSSYSYPGLVEAAQQKRRAVETDGFLAELYAGTGFTAQLPVRVALTEVQLRFFLDERVHILSMDGRTQPVGGPLPRNARGQLDYQAFIRLYRPDAIIEPPQGAMRDPNEELNKAWLLSVRDRFDLQPGLQILRGPKGLLLTGKRGP